MIIVHSSPLSLTIQLPLNPPGVVWSVLLSDTRKSGEIIILTSRSTLLLSYVVLVWVSLVCKNVTVYILQQKQACLYT